MSTTQLVACVAVVLFVGFLFRSALRAVALSREDPPKPLPQRIVFCTDVGAMSDPSNFGLQLAELEGRLSVILREEGLGMYCGSSIHPRGIDLEMAGSDGDRIVCRVNHVVRAHLPLFSDPRVIIRDSHSGRVMRDFILPRSTKSSSQSSLDFDALSPEERAVLEVIATHDARVQFERSAVPPKASFTGSPDEALASLMRSGWIIQMEEAGLTLHCLSSAGVRFFESLKTKW